MADVLSDVSLARLPYDRSTVRCKCGKIAL
jgi:hypothetical protein